MNKHKFSEIAFDAIIASHFGANIEVEDVSREPLLLMVRVKDNKAQEMPRYFTVKISEPI